MVSCHTAPRDAANSPESAQVIGESLKALYIACSQAPHQSVAQQKLVLRMAREASNGKELLLAMRAAVGVFPARTGAPAGNAESHLRSVVVAKMMKLAALDQLIEYAIEYPVNPEDARPFVQRMFQLADSIPDARMWYRIKLAAFHLNAGDLAEQAQAKGALLARGK